MNWTGLMVFFVACETDDCDNTALFLAANQWALPYVLPRHGWRFQSVKDANGNWTEVITCNKHGQTQARNSDHVFTELFY